jgi:acyl carrier protein
VKEKVFEIVARVMNVPIGSVNADSSPDTIKEWDSLKHMDLILTLEEEFGVQFRDEEIVEMLNVWLIMDSLTHKLVV